MSSSAKEWTADELLARCSRRPFDDTAWQEFVRRYHSTIRASVVTTFRRKIGEEPDRTLESSDVVDDLIQAVYSRLVENQGLILDGFEHDHSIFQYLSMISVNVVRDHFREMRALKRPKIAFSLDELLGDNRELINKNSRATNEKLATQPTTTLTKAAIEDALNKVVTGKNRERDILIFRLRYFDGLTLKEIVQTIGIGLAPTSVGSILNRTTRRIKSHLASQMGLPARETEGARPERGIDRTGERTPWSERFIELVNQNDIDGARRVWSTAARADRGPDREEWGKDATEALLKVASQTRHLNLVRQLITESDLEGRLFPLARAIDYLLTGDAAVIERLSPEVRGIVEEVVTKVRNRPLDV